MCRGTVPPRDDAALRALFGDAPRTELGTLSALPVRPRAEAGRRFGEALRFSAEGPGAAPLARAVFDMRIYQILQRLDRSAAGLEGFFHRGCRERVREERGESTSSAPKHRGLVSVFQLLPQLS